MSTQIPLNILLVDDEPLARERLRSLLGDIAGQCPSSVVGEAANGVQALDILREQTVDVVLCDIRMPVMDGIELAAHIGRLSPPPAVIFTTAYDNYAVQAFDLNALDYLLKPVRAQRLLVALQKMPGHHPDPALLNDIGQAVRGSGRRHVSCHERGRLLLVPVDDVLYFKADLKYVTARTVDREYLLDESLLHLESEFSAAFLRLHRAVLVARSALIGLERVVGDDAEAYGWALLRGVPERLPVSRRQWGVVKALLQGS
ncbi:LytTR family DNA-binding domain-containing protein [Azonexus sp.]|uniref:LytR/AlgR family response regulator transcription factor n=1 Tax=Azonexus sp. TaxID=1872668 RepID=UPI0027B923D4|nr:response regulator transcription factor [Azonexus sp.]